MKIIEEFKKIPITNYFRKEYEEIYMSIRLAEDIMDIKNIRSAGDEVEIAVRNFYNKKLFLTCHPKLQRQEALYLR